MRVRRNPVVIEAEAEAWGPETASRFIELAGGRYLRTEGELAVIRNENGTEDTVYPGWLVIVPDGSGRPHFIAPDVLGSEDWCDWQAAE